MADNKTAPEPSMEEILSSIRRIIAEDEPGGQAAAGSATAEPLDHRVDHDDEDEDDVLELTEVVGEPNPPQVQMAPAPAKPAPPSPPPSPAMQEAPTMTAQSAEPLISPVAANASTNAFARLAKAAAPDDKRAVSVAGISVEQLVVDLLTPMLRDWLDQNLPGIVERVVEQEVKKLARRAELM
jgi:cell pole-organizing protein PopZ